MTQKAEEYLNLAEKCERAAGAANLPSTKVAMLACAAVWRRMAAKVGTSDVAGSNTSLGQRPSDWTMDS
jgi:hypothetical protein